MKIKYAFLLLLMCCSCSIVTMRSTPDNLPQSSTAPIHCTSSKGAPVADTIISSSLAITSLGLITTAATETPKETTSGTYGDKTTTTDHTQQNIEAGIGVGLATIAIVYGASAIYGYRESNACTDMKEDQAARTK